MAATLGHRITQRIAAPCHPARHWRVTVWRDLPRQHEVRRCPACGKRWELDLTRLVATPTMHATEVELTQLHAGIE